MKLDILAFGIHPDDVELACSGTLIKHVKLGYKVGICDLTKGEMGTRGTPEIRMEEAEQGRKIIGASVRENLDLGDVWSEVSNENILEVIKIIRKYQPDIVFCNAKVDRHPDHAKGAELIKKAVFLSGLQKIETSLDNHEQEHYRPSKLYYYVQSRFLEPDFVVDISEYMDVKMKSIMAYKSQFYNPKSNEPETFISTKEFLDLLKAKEIIYGKTIGVQYAEGFQVDRYLGIDNVMDLI